MRKTDAEKNKGSHVRFVLSHHIHHINTALHIGMHCAITALTSTSTVCVLLPWAYNYGKTSYVVLP